MNTTIIDRHRLQELRETANGMCENNLNPDWVRAYRALADASDRLDAMFARSELPPSAGWRSDIPENKSITDTPENKL